MEGLWGKGEGGGKGWCRAASCLWTLLQPPQLHKTCTGFARVSSPIHFGITFVWSTETAALVVAALVVLQINPSTVKAPYNDHTGLQQFGHYSALLFNRYNDM